MLHRRVGRPCSVTLGILIMLWIAAPLIAGAGIRGTRPMAASLRRSHPAWQLHCHGGARWLDRRAYPSNSGESLRGGFLDPTCQLLYKSVQKARLNRVQRSQSPARKRCGAGCLAYQIGRTELPSRCRISWTLRRKSFATVKILLRESRVQVPTSRQSSAPLEQVPAAHQQG